MTAKQRKYFGGGRKRRASRRRSIASPRRARRSARRFFLGRRGRRRGGASSGPFRSGGSLVSRVTSSAVPVAKTVVPLVLGAIGAYLLAKKVSPKLKNNPTTTGLAVLAAAILLGSFSKKFGKLPGGARAVQFVAIGAATDGVMRLLYNWRQRQNIPGLPKSTQGLLADASRTASGDELVDLRSADALMALQTR